MNFMNNTLHLPRNLSPTPNDNINSRNYDRRKVNCYNPSESPHIKLVFLLGYPKNPSLESENFVHGDLVQSSVKDHYMSLHYKTLSGFVWVNRY